MTITYTPIYNEMPWTPFFLRHLLEYDCPIVIGEGASEVITNGKYRSTDGSLELLKAFAERWSDRVHLYYHLSTLSKSPGTRYKPRELIKMQAWNLAKHGEFIVGLSPDNFYRAKDIKKLLATIEEIERTDGGKTAPFEIYQIITKQRVFTFNFQTYVKKPIKGICAQWYNIWPCIWRKNRKYLAIIGDELLRHNRTRRVLLHPSVQSHPEQHPLVYYLKGVWQFHYKAVKKPINRRKRWRSAERYNHFMNYPLDGPYLNTYEGPHPSVLDNHPWRHIKDCRKENPDFNWRDYIDLVINP